MTRADFIENVNTWYELREFCASEGCDICDDVYDETSYDDYIDDITSDMIRNERWREVRDWLYDLPDGADYYRSGEDGEWYACDETDFNSYKDDVLEYMDDHEYWDEEDEDDEDEGDEWYEEVNDVARMESEEEPLEPEDIPVGELFTICNSKLQSIEDKNNNHGCDGVADEDYLIDEILF